jgi:DNA-binding transcriptional regulator YiaG
MKTGKDKTLKDISSKLKKKGVNLNSKIIRKLRENDKLTIKEFKRMYGA